MTQSQQGASTQELLPVIQADRDAAARFMERVAAHTPVVIESRQDVLALVQAFAKHRIEHTPSDRNAVLREAANKCDELARKITVRDDHPDKKQRDFAAGALFSAADTIRALKTTTPEPKA